MPGVGFRNPTFADYEIVLFWLETATKKFSRSKLVKQEVKMYMQVIESDRKLGKMIVRFDLSPLTAFPGDTFKEEAARMCDQFCVEVPSWWKRVTSVKAVFDMHWYTAWGTKAGDLTGDAAVLCSQGIDEILEVLSPGIVGFAESFKAQVELIGSISAGKIRVVIETVDFALLWYSVLAVTKERMWTGRKTLMASERPRPPGFVACNDVAITKAFMEKQVVVMKKLGTNREARSPTFEAGWSLKKIYGLQETPRFPCAVGAGVKFPAGDVPCFAGLLWWAWQLWVSAMHVREKALSSRHHVLLHSAVRALGQLDILPPETLRSEFFLRWRLQVQQERRSKAERMVSSDAGRLRRDLCSLGRQASAKELLSSSFVGSQAKLSRLSVVVDELLDKLDVRRAAPLAAAAAPRSSLRNRGNDDVLDQAAHADVRGGPF
ncbi:hypothetical protein AK812_SmicGene7652 [Symbiodinium microadriaticum]|uniref:Uncharacterized protein n=1 Tax=Symbiodinium microadriaticum TaxID=2951 RepID=A0A1Q9EMX3_SYMMI|nr:hypothetical protein AK812_SmicGene7652 [Symbiodinium microadriaticum]